MLTFTSLIKTYVRRSVREFSIMMQILWLEKVMSKKLKLLADENMPLVEKLFGEFADISRKPGRQIQADDLKGVDILLVRSVTQVDSALLAQADQLGFVGTATIGTDHIDQRLLAERRIVFASAPGCNAEAVVDYVLSGIWNHCRDHQLDPGNLTYGVIGCGNVGGRLVERLERLGVTVLQSDPPKAERESRFIDTPLDRLLSQADVICCHTPLTLDGVNATYHLLSADNLARLKPGALLINAGRGPTIDNKALLKRLTDGADICCILDVWELEPEVDAALADRAYIATPHIAGHSLDGKIRGTWMLYQALKSYFGITDSQSDLQLVDILPDAPVSALRSGRSVDPLSLMQLVYDQWRDDRAFRASLDSDLARQKQNFDLLRKNYPLRREYRTLKVSGLESAQQQLLGAIGFNVGL